MNLKDILRVETVLHFLRLPFAKGTKWACGGVKEIGVRFQQRSVTYLSGLNDNEDIVAQ